MLGFRLGKNDPKAKKPAATGRGPSQLSWQVQGSKNHWMSLVRFLEREDLTPTVVFSFSKKVSFVHLCLFELN